jgi:methyl-accepting chemotaxis protein
MYELYRNNRTLYNGWISLTVVIIMFAYTLSIIVTTVWIKEENTKKLKEVEIQQEKSKTLAREVINIGNKIKEYAYNSDEIINELDVSTDNALNIFDDIIKGNSDNFMLVEKQGEMTCNIKDMLKSVENEVENADIMTSKSSKRIEDSYASVDNLKDKSKVIIKNNEELITSIGYFIDSIKKIKTLLGGIAEISEQTEMLALNASIESARAGEAGKGFVHVSNAISSLADNTSNLTSDINAVVERLENSALRARLVAMDVFNNVNEENDIIETTYKDLHDMNSSLRNLSHNIKAVYGSVGNIVDFSEKIESEARELYAASADVTYKTNDTVSLNQDNKQKTKKSKELINNLILLTDKMDAFIKG